jgi:para-aminobenzoate synthetase component 1
MALQHHQTAVFEPIYRKLPPGTSPEVVFSKLCELQGCIWLDSALSGDPRSEYSFIAAAPIDTLVIRTPQADPLATVDQWLEQYRDDTLVSLPCVAQANSESHPIPFQGGIAGLLAYEFGRCFEKYPAPEFDELETPLCSLGIYDVLFAWKHSHDESEDQGWVFSQGYARYHEQAPSEPERNNRAKTRLEQFWQLVVNHHTDNLQDSRKAEPKTNFHAMAHGLKAPQFETRLGGGWLGNFDSQSYRSAIERAKEYIRAGDVFQVNLSQRLLCPAKCSASDLALRLRKVNAAPFAGYYDLGHAQIVSASPERFLSVRNRSIETRPIKGTRRRTGDPTRDKLLEEELIHSEKDRSENIMIVDLLRNDLSRICEIDSLVVDRLCEVETFPFLLHLVSSIRGHLKPKTSFSDVMAAVFPGGSITGAPKVRAMEIIAELEPTSRGPYCGALGYVSPTTNMDWNIAIRTLTCTMGWWQFQVGGGIVADSNAEHEEEETWTKAAGIVAAIRNSLGS